MKAYVIIDIRNLHQKYEKHDLHVNNRFDVCIVDFIYRKCMHY